MHTEQPKEEKLIQQVFSFNNDKDFVEIALAVFHYQYTNNDLYQQFCELVGCRFENVNTIDQIPFLPISFFKSHKVQTSHFVPDTVFESSGTTSDTSSKHFVNHLHIYEKSFYTTFEIFYGPVDQYCILALLPSYLERKQSSLVYMVEKLMSKSAHPSNSFFMYNHRELADTLLQLERQNQKTLLLGVSYALLDFANAFPMKLRNTIIMETGGMKGRKKELIRSELHQQLMDAFEVDSIHSEYGMTELLSQAYSEKDGIFSTPPWMRILIREENDPLRLLVEAFATGGINIIDLANIYSCSFISTEDIGRWHYNGNFEILGRMDNSDVRGCSLLAV
jgi:hypothetical protein